MIRYKQGNILTEDVEALVNPVNCVGVMGKGLALAFKAAFPANFSTYRTACKNHEVQLGQMHVFQTKSLLNPLFIINFPTKGHWRDMSSIKHIDTGLNDLVDTIRNLGIHSIAVPPLGCGLGGLKWDDVSPRIEETLGTLEDVEIVVYEPQELGKTTQ